MVVEEFRRNIGIMFMWRFGSERQNMKLTQLYITLQNKVGPYVTKILAKALSFESAIDNSESQDVSKAVKLFITQFQRP